MVRGTLTSWDGNPALTFRLKDQWLGRSLKHGMFDFALSVAYQCPKCETVLIPGPETHVVSAADETRWSTPPPSTAPERTIKPDPPAGDPPPTWQVYDGEEDSP